MEPCQTYELDIRYPSTRSIMMRRTRGGRRCHGVRGQSARHHELAQNTANRRVATSNTRIGFLRKLPGQRSIPNQTGSQEVAPVGGLVPPGTFAHVGACSSPLTRDRDIRDSAYCRISWILIKPAACELSSIRCGLRSTSFEARGSAGVSSAGLTPVHFLAAASERRNRFPIAS